MGERALSPVLGLLLLVGITAIASVSIFVAGATLTDSVQSGAEEEQIERSMTEFAATADAIAIGESDQGSYAIEGISEGSQIIDTDAGHIELWIENGTDTETILDDDLGEMRYETDQGTVFSYQGGGVWRSDGDGNSRMVRAPSFHYRNDNDPTVTFRHVQVNEPTGAPTSGTITSSTEVDRYPTADDSNPVDQGTVYGEIESEYCTGWEQFFRDRTDSAVDEACETSGESDAGELRVEFSVPFMFPGLGDDATVARTINDHHSADLYDPSDPGNSEERDHDFPVPDAIITQKNEQCADGEGQPLTTTVNSPGLYCSNGMSPGTTYDFDTSGGDIEVAVDGKVNPDGISVTGSNNLTIFAEGDVATDVHGGSEWGQDGDAEQLRILIDSGSKFADNGNGNFEVDAFIYAPDSHVTMPSNVDFDGGMVADTIDVQAAASDYTPDMDVTDIQLRYEYGGEPFYYLHVSETTLEVQGD